MTDGANQPRSRVLVVFAIGALLTSAVWAAQEASYDPRLAPQPLPADASTTGIHKIKHVIIIMQENRSFDEYFGTYPGADGIPMQDGVPTACLPEPASQRCSRPFHTSADINHGGPHTAQAAAQDIDGGRMDGFMESVGDGKVPPCTHFAQPNCVIADTSPDVLGYHDRREIPNYWAYADDFVLQDHMFEPSTSWSLPAHLFMVSAWAAVCSDPNDPTSCVDSGDAGPGTSAARGRPYHQEYIWTDLTYLLHKHQVSWKYYLSEGEEPDCEDGEVSCQPRPQTLQVPSFWNPMPAFQTVQDDGEVKNIQEVTNYFLDAKLGHLPAVSWIIPDEAVSEHPPSSVHAGMAYVTKLVNAAMQGPDWDSTAIFVSWDDWGGFYDHAQPPTVDANGYGIRVPGLVISPYARKGYIDHQVLSFDAYLKFIEDDFLGRQRIDPATDGRPDSRPTVREDIGTLGDLTQDFDFDQAPRPTLLLDPEGEETDAGIGLVACLDLAVLLLLLVLRLGTRR